MLITGISVLVMKSRLLLLCWFLVLPLSAASDTILVVGDSLSSAYGMAVEQGWVQLMRGQIAGAGRDDTVINSSISGDITANALARLPDLLQRHRPDVVILELGGNDGLRGLPLDAMKRNLATMIDRCRAAGAKVLLIGVQLPPNYGPRYARLFEGVYRELAAEKGVALLPSLVAGVGGTDSLMQADGIHPNANAQALIAANVWLKLRPLLEQGQTGDSVAVPVAGVAVLQVHEVGAGAKSDQDEDAGTEQQQQGPGHPCG